MTIVSTRKPAHRKTVLCPHKCSFYLLSEYISGFRDTLLLHVRLETLVREIILVVRMMHVMLLKILNTCRKLLSIAVYVLMHIFEFLFHKFLYYENYEIDGKYKIQFTVNDALDYRQSCTCIG